MSATSYYPTMNISNTSYPDTINLYMTGTDTTQPTEHPNCRSQNNEQTWEEELNNLVISLQKKEAHAETDRSTRQLWC